MIPDSTSICADKEFRQWSNPTISTSFQLQEVEPVDVSYDVQYDGISKGEKWAKKWDQR